MTRDALRAIIVAAFASLTAAQVVVRLDAAGIANARMNDMHEVWAHPQLAARHRWVEVGTPAGPVPALVPPGVAPDAQPRMDPVPALGQHTWRSCASSATTTRTIRRLHAERAV